MQNLNEEEDEECPVCLKHFDAGDIMAHCQTHFPSQESGEPTYIGHDDDTHTGLLCRLGCGQFVAFKDVEDHEAAHRLQDDQEVEKQQPVPMSDERQEPTENLKPGSCSGSGEEGLWACEWPQKEHGAQALERIVDPPTTANICAMQRQASFLEVKPGLIDLLKEALCSQGPGFQAALSGPLHHYHAAPQDVAWGCGWRNIQMLSSHLLQRNEAFRQALFGGCGYVPDISTLQAWLAAAWASGFDTVGADQLGQQIQGSRKWVGTTEAAALLRSFGVRAHVVDFKGGHMGSKRQKKEHSSSAGNTAGVSQSQPPVHEGVQCDNCGLCPIVGPRYKSEVLQNFDLCGKCFALDGAEACAPFTELLSPPVALITSSEQGKVNHGVLVNWIWRYFTEEKSHGVQGTHQPTGLEDRLKGPVILSGKPPLYFQHEGHSRTIVGIEKRVSRGNQPEASDQYFLLILDPSQGTAPLEKALRERSKWQRLMKRSMQTLQKLEYQLLYCLDGLARGPELEELKVMRATQQFGF